MSPRVGVVRDERYLEHKTGLIHPEHPNRLLYLYRMLDAEFFRDLLLIEPEPVTLEDLELVHTPGYVKKVLRTAERGFTPLAFDTPAGAKSYMAAWLAVGGCIKALMSLVSGECAAAFSLVRPPGHHALPDRAGGFCIFNNLGVAARYATERLGMKRILIIDWDLHHGNALQDLFYRDPRVFYLSSHCGNIYPHTGDWAETGEGDGEGYNVNIVIPKGLKEDELLYLYQEVAGPVFRRFRPEMVFIAAGFDLHRLDIMSGFEISETTFRMLTRMFRQLAAENGHPPLLLSLEGGYRIPALVPSVREVFRELLADAKMFGPITEPSDRVRELAEKVRGVHAHYHVWTDGNPGSAGP